MTATSRIGAPRRYSISTLLDHLRAEPSANGRVLPWLDGIRGMAVLFILFRHAWGLSAQPALIVHLPGHKAATASVVDMLSSGIDLFFVLSAFLLAQKFIRADMQGKPPPSLRDFYRSRILRIGPPYWTVLVLSLVLLTPALIPSSLLFSERGGIAVGFHSVFLQTVWMGSYGIWQIDSPFWTLTIEMIFYAILPFIVWAFYRRRAFTIGVPLGLLITVVWLALCRWSMGPLVHFISHTSLRPDANATATRYFLSQQIPASAFDFALGMAAANLFVRKQLGRAEEGWLGRITSPVAGTVTAGAGALIVVMAMWQLGRVAIPNQYYFGLAVGGTSHSAYAYYFLSQIPFALGYSLLIVGVAFGHAAARRLFGMAPLALFGILGYSIYLIHMPLLYLWNSETWLQKAATPTTHLWELLGCTVASVLVLSTGLYLAVERPFMLRSRSARSMPSVAGPASSGAAAHAYDVSSKGELITATE